MEANPRVTRYVALCCGAYALLGGSLALGGWATGLVRLTDWGGSGIVMKTNTAIAAAIAGLALVLVTLRPRARRTILCLSTLVAAIGALTLSQYLTGISLGIDTLLFDEPPGALATSSPNRMGPPAAVSFALIGTALALTSRGPRARRGAVVLSLVVFAIALLSLTGYAYGAEVMYMLPSLTGIAVQTSSILAVLAVGVMAAVPECEPCATLGADSEAGLLARRLLPVVIAVPLLVGWGRLQGQLLGLYDTAFGSALRTVLEVGLLAGVTFLVLRAVRAREHERDRFEVELRASQQRLAATLASISDGLVTFDRDWRFSYANPEAERMLGYERAQLIGQSVWDLFPELRGTSTERDMRTAASDHTTVEFENTNRTGLVISHRAYPTADGGLAVYFHDVSRRRQMEDALREADRRKDEFLATLAHELRNPLAPIRNAAKLLLLRNAADPQLRWSAEVIHRQVEHMSRLLDDLLDVSRISRNRLELRREWTDLATVLGSALETSRPLVEVHRHALTVELPRDAIFVDADPVRLAQVFSNLVNNAAKYMDDGGRISVRAERRGAEAVISVRDAGMGLAAEALPHIFDIFWQAAPAHERSSGGLGIGLSLARGIVDLHGGRIEVFSEGPGRGSEFVVHLPVALDAQQALPAVAEPPRVRAEHARRVLVVDDVRDHADSLAAVLTTLGHDARAAYGGRQGLEAAREMQPDAVLLDIGMPDLDGFAVCRRLRQQPGGDVLLIIALTGWGQKADRARTNEAGFDHHLIKPAEIATIARLLDQAPRQSPG
jgi:PAS domain S-box-containing protein